MNNKILGLVLVGSSLVSALSSFDSVSAATLNMNWDNVTHNLEGQSDKFQDKQTDIISTAWLDNRSLAKTMVNHLGLQGHDILKFTDPKKNGEIQINSWVSDNNLTTIQTVTAMVSAPNDSTNELPDPLSSLTAGCRFWRCLTPPS
jgi:hypothetical protein